jgi:hypothetical protein
MLAMMTVFAVVAVVLNILELVSGLIEQAPMSIRIIF